MIIDPWGRVIADCEEKSDTFVLAPIDSALVERYRTELPCLKHRNQKLGKD